MLENKSILEPFNCSGCNVEVKKSMYAIAQLASWNDLDYTCKCGAVTHLKANN